MPLTIVSDVTSGVLPLILAAVDKSTVLINWMAPFILAGVTLYIMLYGWELVRGGGGNNLALDLFEKIVRPFIVFAIALTGGMYASTVVGIFTELRTDLVNLFGGTGNTYANLDAALESVLLVLASGVNDAMQSLSLVPFNLNGLLLVVCMGVIALCFFVYAIFVALNVIFIDIGLMILFGFGPIFVACFAFQATAKFFDAWLNAVLKYTFTAVLLSMVIGVANSLIGKFVARMVASPDLASMIFNVASAFVGLSIIIGLVLRTATFAADMVGGASISFSGGGAVSKAMSAGGSAAAGAAGGVANAGAYVGGAAMSAAGRGASAFAATSSGAAVMRATESMRARMGPVASQAATGAKNFGYAVSGRASTPSGGVSTGHGASNAFSLGRQAAMSKRSEGLGTVSGIK